MRRIFAIFGVAVLIPMLAPSLGWAHALGVDCKLKAGTVEIEAFYDDDTPALKAKVQIVNAKEEIVATGVTDEKGHWAFASPAPGKYEVRVDAGAGHRAKKAFEVPAGTPSENPLPKEITISEGATRAEFTSTPWLKIGIGLGTIGALCGAFLLASIFRNRV